MDLGVVGIGVLRVVVGLLWLLLLLLVAVLEMMLSGGGRGRGRVLRGLPARGRDGSAKELLEGSLPCPRTVLIAPLSWRNHWSAREGRGRGRGNEVPPFAGGECGRGGGSLVVTGRTRVRVVVQSRGSRVEQGQSETDDDDGQTPKVGLLLEIPQIARPSLWST